MMPSQNIVFQTIALIDDLEPSPIDPELIISGSPKARSKILSKSQDGTSYMLVWECSAGAYRRHYVEDQSTVIIGGEVWIKPVDGKEHRLAQGDTIFFPAGSSAEWRIPRYVKKIAIMRKALGYPLGFGVRAFYKLSHIAGRRKLIPVSSITSPKPVTVKTKKELESLLVD